MMDDDDAAQMAEDVMDEVQRHHDAMQGIMAQHGMAPDDEDQADTAG